MGYFGLHPALDCARPLAVLVDPAGLFHQGGILQQRVRATFSRSAGEGPTDSRLHLLETVEMEA